MNHTSQPTASIKSKRIPIPATAQQLEAMRHYTFRVTRPEKVHSPEQLWDRTHTRFACQHSHTLILPSPTRLTHTLLPYPCLYCLLDDIEQKLDTVLEYAHL